MTQKIFDIEKSGNSVDNYLNCIRQRISLAIFGVPEGFKNYLSSIIDKKVLIIEKDAQACLNTLTAVREFSDKIAVYVPAKDETLAIRKAFSKDILFNRIVAIESFSRADIIICTVESAMQLFPKKVCALTLKKGMEIEIFMLNVV